MGGECSFFQCDCVNSAEGGKQGKGQRERGREREREGEGEWKQIDFEVK